MVTFWIRSFSFSVAVSWEFLTASIMLVFSVSVKEARLVTLIFLSGFKLAFLTARLPCFILKVEPFERLSDASSAEIERVAALPVLYCRPSLTFPVTSNLAGLVEVASVKVEMFVAFASPNESSKTFVTIVALVVPEWTFVFLI